MRLATLLPHLAGVHITRADLTPDAVTLEIAARASSARCPACGRRSRRIHGYYTRTVADQPLGERRLTLHLCIRRFRCQVTTCRRQTFTQPPPALVARYARRSRPLQRLLADIGLTLGGWPGARFAARRRVLVSRMTLLRRVRALPEPAVVAPAVLGVDDFALARGRRYGTVLVDLTTHRPIDLLPERTAAALARWLTAHGQPAIICRDRGGDYAAGARQGAPDAVQVADRWHLLKNVGDALERVVGRHRAALRRATDDQVAAGPAAEAGGAVAAVHPALTDPSPAPAVSLAPAPAARPDARRDRYEAVVARQRQGQSVSAISRATGVTRPTIRRWLAADGFPERAARPARLDALSPHAAYLRARWVAGCRDAATLWREVRARGFAGSAVTVRRHVQAWRAYPHQRPVDGRRATRGERAAVPPSPPAAPRPPSPRQVRWWLLTPAADLEPDERADLERLQADCPAMAQAAALATAFGRLVRAREQAAFAPWLAAAEASGLVEFGVGERKLRVRPPWLRPVAAPRR